MSGNRTLAVRKPDATASAVVSCARSDGGARSLCACARGRVRTRDRPVARRTLGAMSHARGSGKDVSIAIAWCALMVTPGCCQAVCEIPVDERSRIVADFDDDADDYVGAARVERLAQSLEIRWSADLQTRPRRFVLHVDTVTSGPMTGELRVIDTTDSFSGTVLATVPLAGTIDIREQTRRCIDDADTLSPNPCDWTVRGTLTASGTGDGYSLSSMLTMERNALPQVCPETDC